METADAYEDLDGDTDYGCAFQMGQPMLIVICIAKADGDADLDLDADRHPH